MSHGPRAGLLERYGPILILLVAGTVAVGIVLLRGGVDASQVGRAYLLSAGALVILALLMELRRTPGSRAVPPPPSSREIAPLPSQLSSLQDSLRASRVSRSQYQLQVLPLLREVAADRLQLLGISMAREPELAAAALGPYLTRELAELRTDGGSVFHRGPAQRELEAVLTALEAIGR
ncbi:MAG: hypothetical protein ACRENX_00600 [Candidatus Dormibacteria bacterium]